MINNTTIYISSSFLQLNTKSPVSQDRRGFSNSLECRSIFSATRQTRRPRLPRLHQFLASVGARSRVACSVAMPTSLFTPACRNEQKRFGSLQRIMTRVLLVVRARGDGIPNVARIDKNSAILARGCFCQRTKLSGTVQICSEKGVQLCACSTKLPRSTPICDMRISGYRDALLSGLVN
jgi:hypothetical protein